MLNIITINSQNWEQYIENVPRKLLVYGPDTVHARGIFCANNKLFTANSNGHVYEFDLKKNKTKQWTVEPFVELRDIHIHQDQIHFMQSNDSCVAGSIKKKYKNKEIIFTQPIQTFLDGFDFLYSGRGIMLGDPVDGKFQFYLKEKDSLNWKKIESDNLKIEKGEAAFAASGSCIQILDDSTFYFISGGKNSNLFTSFDNASTWKKYKLPFKSSESSGAFSFVFWNKKEGIVVGGDYLNPQNGKDCCFLTNDGGKTWKEPIKGLGGYRSCVIKVDDCLYACGTNGIDVSNDNGMHWYLVDKSNSFSLCFDEKFVYATTINGKILQLKRWKNIK
ncbi:MAG: hypothetical protein HYU67_09695 [Flavobacteriia bacterium]|nr:hypothetical protein [Flavobacteriia bacterium]